ncbi:hypothetical protein [Deinococcus roseus]|uniref:Uncharacterized protein n=1 Tax=Deinococcus roseus TaxID=392414 RepID=A0ABQ2DH68_9DEIO|nr:hypothetical protein [Deinococcus roseus]GGJ55499.1 hypothetical protein GCM10008938_47080 [Deinococcus roseus]
MPSIQIKDMHLLVYHVLSRLGFTHPGKSGSSCWTGKDFMTHARLQFEMAARVAGQHERFLPSSAPIPPLAC